MRNKVLSLIRKYNMISEGDTVVVALSGGADSVCLLHILYSLKDELGITLKAAHLNHMIRGAEADRDESFVKDICEKLGIPLAVGHIDIPHEAEKSGESLEECARRLRYDFLLNTDSSAKLATAHNLNDSAETFFLNTARGTGLAGLTGIPPVRGRIIRPLLDVSRDEIEEYCKTNLLEFITDSTNLSDDYARNKIRHNIIPVMKAVNPSFLSVFEKNTASLKDDMLFINSVVDKEYEIAKSGNGYSADYIASLDNSIRHRLTARIIKDTCGITPEMNHLFIIDGLLKTGGAVELDREWFAEVKHGIFSVEKVRKKEKSVYIEIDDCSDSYYNDVFSLEFVHIDKKFTISKQNIKKLSFDNYADYDKIITDGVIRNRRGGDSFRKPFNGFTSSLKNLFREKQIPPDVRERCIMIESDGNIVWNEFFGTSEYGRIDENTKNIIQIVFRRN